MNVNYITKLKISKFLVVGSLGSVTNIVIFYFNPELKVIAQLLGIISGTITNYLGAKNWVFNAKR